MGPLYGQFGRLTLVVVVAVVAQLPAVADADSLVTGISPLPVETIWNSPPLLPIEGDGPADSGESLPLHAFDIFAGELFAADDPAPGFEFSLNPADSEVLLGWRFLF